MNGEYSCISYLENFGKKKFALEICDWVACRKKIQSVPNVLLCSCLQKTKCWFSFFLWKQRKIFPFVLCLSTLLPVTLQVLSLPSSSLMTEIK